MKIAYYDKTTNSMLTRDATAEEEAQVQMDALDAETKNIIDFNKDIIRQLKELDSKSIRALREGNQERIQALEAECAYLRLQFK